MKNGVIVIVCYSPKPNKDQELLELVANHVPRLRQLNLVTDRSPVIMRSKDGTIVEVFEWSSEDAIEAAHSHPEVKSMWDEFEEVCTYQPANEIAEFNEPFSAFTPINNLG